MIAFSSDFELYFIGEVNINGYLVPAKDGPAAITFLSDILQTYKVRKEEGADLR